MESWGRKRGAIDISSISIFSLFDPRADATIPFLFFLLSFSFFLFLGLFFYLFFSHFSWVGDSDNGPQQKFERERDRG